MAKFRNILGRILPFAGPILGSLIPGLGPVAGAALGGAAGSAGGAALRKQPASDILKQGALGGVLGGVGGKLTGGFGVPPKSYDPNLVGYFSNYGAQGIPQAVKTGALSAPNLSMLGQFGTAASRLFGLPQAAQKVGGATQSLLGNFGDFFGGGNAFAQTALPATGATPTAGGGVQASAGLAGQPSNFIRNMLGGNDVLGTGLLATGLLKQFPKVPPLPASVEELRAQIEGGGGALRQQATNRLSGLLGEEFNPLTEPEIQAATRDLDLRFRDEEDQLKDLYRNLRPGSQPDTDSSFRRDLNELRDRYSRARADLLANRSRELEDRFNVNQRFAIQQALGADDTQMAQLTQLAQLDVSQIQAQLGLDVQQAAFFKNTFANLGSDIFLESISPGSSAFRTLFGGRQNG